MTIHDLIVPWRKKLITIALVAAILLCPFARHAPDSFFHAYLFAFLAWFGLSIGALGLLLLYFLTGGQWGQLSRKTLSAMAGTLKWTGLLFIPVLLGLHHIYPWAQAGYWADASMRHKKIFFNVPFFVLRAVFYFLCWIAMAGWASRFERSPQAGSSTPSDQARSGLSLVLYFFTVSFAAFDWFMSLEPHWSSSIYGAMIIVGCILSAWAFVVAALAWLNERGAVPLADPAVALDLGNLLLAFVMLWTYMALSQFLIIWSGNLPEEIGWYIARSRGGWQYVTTPLVLGQFVLPFLLLLIRKNKQRMNVLGKVACLVLGMRVIDAYWLVAPDFSPAHFTVHIMDFMVLVMFGGAWLYFFLGELARVTP